jgi:hypothetical protein
MIVQTRDSVTERTVLTGMIVNTEVLGRLSPKWTKDGLFSSDWSNVVAGWCVRYYGKYGKAPEKAVETLFASWADGRNDRETVKLVERYLSSLSGQYQRTKKKINPAYVLDLAGDHFNAVRLKRLADALAGDIDAGKVQDGWKRIDKLGRVEVGVGARIDVLQNKAAMRAAFEDAKSDVLVKYPGALGRFFGGALEREGFVAFMGPEKRGKTWWLLDLAWRAMLQRKRVAFFEVGDLSERQILRRFGVRAAGRPMKPTPAGRVVNYPTKLVRKDDAAFDVVHDPRTYKDWLTWPVLDKAMKKVMLDRVKSKESYLGLSVHANSSISVGGIRTTLREWETTGWRPEVVVIDYADILAPPAGFQGESRDAVNETWKALRRMSQELHCLVVTATQANAMSYTADSLSMQNFSEDKRKFSHVTGMVGINQSNPEKEKGVQRLNWLVLREDEFLVQDHVLVAGCLAVANPAVCSA